jgi:hypothetical protein
LSELPTFEPTIVAANRPFVMRAINSVLSTSFVPEGPNAGVLLDLTQFFESSRPVFTK